MTLLLSIKLSTRLAPSGPLNECMVVSETVGCWRRGPECKQASAEHAGATIRLSCFSQLF